MALDITATARGFALGEFVDYYGKVCSIQKSSLAMVDCIWLGVDDVGGQPARMHLTRNQVADLLPLLQWFVETGELQEPETKETPMAVEIPTPIDTKTSLEHAVQSATNTLHGWYARRVASGKSPITRAAMHTRLLAVWPRVSPDVAGQIIDEVMGIERAPEAAPVYEPERGLRRSDLLANSIIKDTNGERTRVQVAVSQANHPEQHMQCSAAYAWHSIASIAAVGHFNAEGKTKPYTAAEIIEAAGILCEHYTSQVKAPGA